MRGVICARGVAAARDVAAVRAARGREGCEGWVV